MSRKTLGSILLAAAGAALVAGPALAQGTMRLI